MPCEARLENFWLWTMKKQHIKEIIYQAKWGKKKIMEKLNRAQKYLILEPQNLGLRGARTPWSPGSAPGLLQDFNWNPVIMRITGVLKILNPVTKILQVNSCKYSWLQHFTYMIKRWYILELLQDYTYGILVIGSVIIIITWFQLQDFSYRI